MSDQALTRTTSRLLRAYGAVDLLSTALTVLSVAMIATSAGGVAFWIATLLLGGFEKVLALRIRFDAELLSDVADERLDAPALDAALVELGLIRSARERSWRERCAGARSLFVRGLIVSALQLAMAVAARC